MLVPNPHVEVPDRNPKSIELGHHGLPAHSGHLIPFNNEEPRYFCLVQYLIYVFWGAHIAGQATNIPNIEASPKFMGDL